MATKTPKTQFDSMWDEKNSSRADSLGRQVLRGRPMVS